MPNLNIKDYTFIIKKDNFHPQHWHWNFSHVHHFYIIVSFIPYFCLLVFGILVTLVAWSLFCFFCLAHLALQNVNKDYATFSYLHNFVAKKWPKIKNKKYDMIKNINTFFWAVQVLVKAWNCKSCKLEPRPSLLLLYIWHSYNFTTESLTFH